MRPVRIKSKEVFSVPISKFNAFHHFIISVAFHITINLPLREEGAEASQLQREDHPAAEEGEEEAVVVENPYFYRQELQSNLNAILLILL